MVESEGLFVARKRRIEAQTFRKMFVHILSVQTNFLTVFYKSDISKHILQQAMKNVSALVRATYFPKAVTKLM